MLETSKAIHCKCLEYSTLSKIKSVYFSKNHGTQLKNVEDKK